MPGVFGENFPYSNFHDLNMDWIIKIAKDFLDQYSHIQDIISNGIESLNNTTEEGLEELESKYEELNGLLTEWYETHSEDIEDQLASALSDLNTWYTQHEGFLNTYVADSITAFGTAADAKAAQALASIPVDYTSLYNQVQTLSVLMTPIIPHIIYMAEEYGNLMITAENYTTGKRWQYNSSTQVFSMVNLSGYDVRLGHRHHMHLVH